MILIQQIIDAARKLSESCHDNEGSLAAERGEWEQSHDHDLKKDLDRLLWKFDSIQSDDSYTQKSWWKFFTKEPPSKPGEYWLAEVDPNDRSRLLESPYVCNLPNESDIDGTFSIGTEVGCHSENVVWCALAEPPEFDGVKMT